jgi:hypothetical protein
VVCVGLALGEGTGEGRGVATGFETEFEASAGDPLLLGKLESRTFCAAAEVDRSAEVLLAFAGPTVRLFAFEFRFSPALLLVDRGEAIRLLALEFRFDSTRGFDRGVSRPAFAAIAELAPATVNTTSSRFACCSTRALAPGGSRKEITVLSPLRCTFTSAKPRPRRASARGTSEAGILI